MITVSWTPTSLGADFDAYLIKRGGDLIAEVRSESIEDFSDYEHRWGVEESYTVQVRHINGTVSLPSTTATVTKAAPVLLGEGSGWGFGSNHAADEYRLAVGVGAQFTFHHDDAEYSPYGTGHARVIKGLFDRGDEITATVLLDGVSGSAKYDDLKSIADADVPHWAVTDRFGSRWLVAVALQTSTEELAWQARPQIRLREVTDRPTPVTVQEA